MITAIVQYRLPSSIDLKACAEHYRKIAPDFRAVPGLIRKQFIYAEDGWAGGVYLWKTRADAEAFYSGPWLDGIRERYGRDPQIKYFHTACVTDNSAEAPQAVSDAVMRSKPMDECEIKVRGDWQRIDIAAALGLDWNELMRCPECHGQVSAHKAGTTGQRAHFEHLIKHDGCSLKPGFSGTRSLHPKPIQ